LETLNYNLRYSFSSVVGDITLNVRPPTKIVLYHQLGAAYRTIQIPQIAGIAITISISITITITISITINIISNTSTNSITIKVLL